MPGGFFKYLKSKMLCDQDCFNETFKKFRNRNRFPGQMLLSEMATRKNITNFLGKKVNPQFQCPLK